MIFFVFKTIFISLLLIGLIHYLYGFFKNTLTIPKVKDLVNKPAKSYNEMFEVINNKQIERNTGSYNTGSYNLNEIIPQNISKDMDADKTMQYELKNFLNDLKKTNTSIPDVSNFSTNSYTPYDK